MLLELREVTKKIWDGRNRRAIIDGASLEIDAGEWIVLRGPSGSGKTTLLTLMTITAKWLWLTPG